ncbi:MAG: glycosyltransferase family 2 protein [Pseudomonadota bacterium]
MSFSVCMLSNEEIPFIDTFVHYYLELGAREISIYLDFAAPRPSYPDHPNVRIIQCEELFMVDGTPVRPDSFYLLQRTVYTHAFENFTSDWLLICDADEFVGGDTPVDEVLQAVPAEWDFVRMPVAEAIWGPGDALGEAFSCTYFRTRAPRGFGKLLSVLLYGRVFALTKAGLTGHSMGKYFIRKTSRHTELGVHVPRGVAMNAGPWTTDIPSKPDICLYHFEAIGYDRWIAKWSLRVKRGKARKTSFNAAKRNYIDIFAAHQRRGTERQLFEAIYRVNGTKVAVLKALGLLRRKQLWPDGQPAAAQPSSTQSSAAQSSSDRA